MTNCYEYIPYGEMMMLNTTMDYDHPYKFNGKELDMATGYYYYGARYYDPKRSFWLSVDPLADITVSPYAYVWNDPVNFADPTGMMGERKGGTDPCDPPARRSFVRRAWDWLFGARVDHGYKSNVRLQVNNRLEVGIPTKISEEDYQNTTWDSGNTRYEQVTRNTLITRKIGANNESPQYRFILPQNFGGWSQDDTASDGLIWKGCLSCHSDNGAFTYATHNSQEANAGNMASALLQTVVGVSFGSGRKKYSIEEFGDNFAIFSFKGKGKTPNMTIVVDIEAQGTHANAKVDIIPTIVMEGGIEMEAAYAKYANKIGIKEYKTAIETWTKSKGFKSIRYHGERVTGRAKGRIQSSKKYDLK